MNNILKSMRLHIGLLGKRNVGKSSLLNFITGQDVSIISDIAGTTTDVVEKAMELTPVGPVLFIDTAGIDDEGTLGEERIKKTLSILDRIDIALIICDSTGITSFEQDLIEKCKIRNIPIGIIINKNDLQPIPSGVIYKIDSITKNNISVNTKDNSYIINIIQLILNIMPNDFFDEERILNDIIEPQETVIQVIPIDKEAPKGRLILPQVRTIRNVLDIGATSLVTNEVNLKSVLDKLNYDPKLVITDSQAFKKVEEIVPKNILLTSYSIAFAKLKGDLLYFAKCASKINELNDGDKILICESCTHPASCEDIGRVKIPNLIKKYTNKNLVFEIYSGHDFPNDLRKYSLIIHCGGCMTNKREILSRIILAKEANVPMTNYGIAIAYCLGILDRAIEPFI